MMNKVKIDALKEFFLQRDACEFMVDETYRGLLTFFKLPDRQGIYIEEVFVFSEYRHLGIGRDLVEQVKNLAKNLELDKVYTTVNPLKGDPTASVKAVLGVGFKMDSVDGSLLSFSMKVGV